MSDTGNEDGSGDAPRRRRGYAGWEVLVSAVVGLAVAFLLVWVASGFNVFHEELFRVAPTVEDGGVGADWLAGNTIPALDFLIALVHAADVIMGVFILVMVFVHWASFRRLAGRMRQPGEDRADAVATDGGRDGDPGPSSGPGPGRGSGPGAAEDRGGERP